jgi:hypothetical protein
MLFGPVFFEPWETTAGTFESSFTMLQQRCFASVLLAFTVACGTSATDKSPNVAGAGGDGTMSSAGSAGQGGTTGGASSPVAGQGGGASGASGSGANNGGSAASGANNGGAGGAGGSSLGGTGTGVGGSPFPVGVTKPRIMIVGDSISAGPGCYKKYLLKDLTDNHYTQFEFVGEYTDDCGGNVRHSAVSCSTAEQYTQATFTLPNCFADKTFPGLATLVATHKPDLLMLQLGVNDVWGGKGTEETLGNYQKLVEQARAQNPNVVLAVAQIQKIRPDCGTDETVQKRAEALVMAVPAWAQKLATATSPIYVADLWTNSDWSMAETNDCVHPNDVGAQRMGLNWYNTLKLILKPD